jgi:hypothetical protein
MVGSWWKCTMPRLARRLLASYDQHLLIFIIPEAEIRECRGCIDHLHPVLKRISKR